MKSALHYLTAPLVMLAFLFVSFVEVVVLGHKGDELTDCED